jgi:hypothetical protein
MKTVHNPIIWLVCLVFFLSACSGAAQTANPAPAGVVPTNASPTTSLPATQPALPSLTVNPIHGLGQAVEVNGLTIAMIEVGYDSNQLQVKFVAKNTGSEVVSTSSIFFSATSTTGMSLKGDYCMVTPANSQKKLSSASPFTGILQPGEILKGTICWDGAAPQNGNQVGYAPDLGKPAITLWDVSSAGTGDVPTELTTNTFTTPPHAEGESVALKDITITFEQVTLTGFINAHFSVENRGSSPYKFEPPLAASQTSAPLGDSFSYRLPDGSPLLGGIFMNSGCQNVSTNIEVPPGQKVSLDVCFGNYSPILTVTPGSLVSFIPSKDEGEQVNWLTK